MGDPVLIVIRGIVVLLFVLAGLVCSGALWVLEKIDDQRRHY